MTDLSPEAQAVLDVVMDEIWGLKPEDVPRLASESRQYAVAALRALVLQMETTFWPECRWPYIAFIDNIADELEKHKP